MGREASCVSFLMCPFCVRDLLPTETTFCDPTRRLRLIRTMNLCGVQGSGYELPFPQRSMVDMFASLWRSPVAGVRSFSRAIWSALSSTRSAAVFSSTRETRLVPGIGAMSSPCASSQAKATCAGVAPTSEATASTSSTMRRFCSKLPRGLRWPLNHIKPLLAGAPDRQRQFSLTRVWLVVRSSRRDLRCFD
jgi:hypothetical protein